LAHFGVEYNFQVKDTIKKIKQTNLNNHNGIFSSSTTACIEKVKKTKLQKYGDENFVNVEKARYTKLQKYGDENFTNRKKASETNLNRYGNASPLWGEEQIKKKKESWIKKYGVDNPLKNKKIYDKAFKTRIKIKQYKDTNLTYQGSYEFDFLENFYSVFNDIQNGLSIKYTINNKQHIYHSDFYIPSLNLIIEIKNRYLAKTHKEEIEAKQNAVLNNGYNYIMIIDKHYKFFKNLYVKDGYSKK